MVLVESAGISRDIKIASLWWTWPIIWTLSSPWPHDSTSFWLINTVHVPEDGGGVLSIFVILLSAQPHVCDHVWSIFYVDLLHLHIGPRKKSNKNVIDCHKNHTSALWTVLISVKVENTRILKQNSNTWFLGACCWLCCYSPNSLGHSRAGRPPLNNSPYLLLDVDQSIQFDQTYSFVVCHGGVLAFCRGIFKVVRYMTRRASSIRLCHMDDSQPPSWYSPTIWMDQKMKQIPPLTGWSRVLHGKTGWVCWPRHWLHETYWWWNCSPFPRSTWVLLHCWDQGLYKTDHYNAPHLVHIHKGPKGKVVPNPAVTVQVQCCCSC